MHPLRLYRWLRTLIFVIPALALASCVYRPVVMSDYEDASGYAELLASIEGDRELQTAIDRNVVRIMRPGELVPGWRESGIDLDQVLNAAPGGRADNVFLHERGDDVFSFSSERAFQEFFGQEYTIYPVLGTEAMFGSVQDDQFFGLHRIGEGVWFETLTRGDEMGTAGCSSGGAEAARLHTSRPFASLNKLEKSTLAVLVAAAGRNDSTICGVAEADGEARWRPRYFLPDGRRLPVYDREGAFRMTIVPRAEVGPLIAGS